MQLWPWFGALVLLTLWMARGLWNVLPIAVMLLASYLVSNVVHYQVDSLAEQAMDYTLLEVLVSSSAFMVYMCGGSRALTALVFVSAVSIVANLVAGWQVAPTKGQVNLWEGITNVCFTLECVILCGVAWHERRRQHSRLGSRDRVPAPHGIGVARAE